MTGIHSFKRYVLQATFLSISILVSNVELFAQGGGGGGTAAGGVFIDPEGVIRSKDLKYSRLSKRELKEIEKNKALTYISIPRFLEDIHVALDAGKPLSDNQKYLNGMVRIRFVFIEPGEDLIIAGDSEPIEITEDDYRPVGKYSKRPVIHLEDLVLSLSEFGPHGGKNAFGCSIDMPPGGMNRMVNAVKKFGAVRGNANQISEAMSKACGHQPVRVFGIPNDSRIALVCLEADVIMKRLALGLDQSPVKGVRSQLSMTRNGEPIYTRRWFTAKYDGLKVDDDQLGFEILGPRIKVKASDSPNQDTSNSPSAEQFAKDLSDHMDETAEVIPAFADLQNLTDLALIASLIRIERLDRKANWDIAKSLENTHSLISQWTVPKTCETLVSAQKKSRTFMFMAGGVHLNTDFYVSADYRKSDETGTLEKVRLIPEGSIQTIALNEDK